MSLDFRSLEIFVAVTRLRSFARAAEKLHTTQPAVSQRIAGLESALGRRLLDRSARLVAPTEAGRLLLEHAERVLVARRDLVLAVGDPAALSGTICVGVSETVVYTFLPRFLERIAEAHPRLQLEIEVDISPGLKERLLARELDLAFLVGPVAEPRLAEVPIGREPLGFFAAPTLGLHRRPFRGAALGHHPILTFARRTAPYAAIAALLDRAAGPGRWRIHGSTSLATLLRMATGGIGVAAIPPVIAAEAVAAGRLVALDGPALPPLRFFACWRAELGSASLEAAMRAVEALAGRG